MQSYIKQNLDTFSAAKIGAVFAWLGVLTYASSNSIATLLVEIGEANPIIDGRNAITFANLLLLGSLISLVPLAVLFGKDVTRANVKALSKKDWVSLNMSALLSSAITPGLFFFALEHSNVTNVVLISRVEPPLFLLAAFVFLKERLDVRALWAGCVALLGAMIMISLRDQNGYSSFGLGEMAAAGATISYVASAVVARRALRNIPMGIFSIYRAAVGTALYFILVSAIQGPQTFQDIFAPVLLQWVWLYAVPVIVFAQIAWFVALKYAHSGDVSLATSFSPLAGILFAMLILGENPGPGFVPGSVLILLAIAMAQLKEPLNRKLQRAWENRPTYDAGEVASIMVPAAAFPGAMNRRYNGSY